jgi:hypothetical protein
MLKARATTFYEPVHNALDKEAPCARKEGEGSHWLSVYIQKPFMTLYTYTLHVFELVPSPVFSPSTVQLYRHTLHVSTANVAGRRLCHYSLVIIFPS